jgi:hypothetical protein
MKIKMPLHPDPQMKGPEGLRHIEADLPDDITQSEFWEFVALAGSQMFGDKEEEREGRQVSTWNPVDSLKSNFPGWK